MLEDLRVGYARKMAREVIKKFSITKLPVNMSIILEGYGFQYLEVESFPEKLDALFIFNNGISYAAVNKNHHLHRKKFSLAHELGHKLMNHDVNYYKSSFTIDNPPNKDEHHKLEDIFEKEANIFAGELLVPLNMLKSEFKKSQDIPSLSRIFEVSQEVMSIRIKDHMGILFK
jgi:Zn-dependent peptidase ImmA (M78 family)